NGLTLRTEGTTTLPPGSRVTVGFRPEEVSVEAQSSGGARENVLPCRVKWVEFRGPFVRNYLTLSEGGGETVLVDVPVHDATRADAPPGTAAGLYVRPESVRVFGGDGAGR